MDINYRKEGDYLLPDLTVPESPALGKYGLLRRNFLRDHRNGLYTGMLLSGKLEYHLEGIERDAVAMEESLVVQLAAQQGVTEELKASDQLRWVGLMNGIRASAEEVVLAELIHCG